MQKTQVHISYSLFAILLAALNTLGPFSTDTYLPAFASVQSELAASALEVQQSLTAYMLPLSFMMLWHGALSDALGRRRVILVGLITYVAGSIICIAAQRIEVLWLGRALQGLSAGAGVVVGRAVLRDVFDGAAAQRLMSHVMMVFAVAPAIAPILGGLLSEHWGWRSVFVFLALLAAAIAALVWYRLPETLPAEQRQSLHPMSLLRAYTTVLSNARFLSLCIAGAMLFGTFFVYVMSAPVFLMQHLHLQSTEFGWMFVPMVGGMLLGSVTSVRMAGRLPQRRLVQIAYGVSGLAVLVQVLGSLWLPDSVGARIPPLALLTFAMSLAMPVISLRALDMHPERRGMASSCQGAIQTLVMAGIGALIAPALWDTSTHLAWGSAACWAVSALALWWSGRGAALRS